MKKISKCKDLLDAPHYYMFSEIYAAIGKVKGKDARRLTLHRMAYGAKR